MMNFLITRNSHVMDNGTGISYLSVDTFFFFSGFLVRFNAVFILFLYCLMLFLYCF